MALSISDSISVQRQSQVNLRMVRFPHRFRPGIYSRHQLTPLPCPRSHRLTNSVRKARLPLKSPQVLAYP